MKTHRIESSRRRFPSGRKLRVGVLFGGRSAEHEVSLVSANSIMRALDRSKYEVVPIGVTPEGKWISSSSALTLLRDFKPTDKLVQNILLPDPRTRGLFSCERGGGKPSGQLDVIFPVLHGTFGEDGTMQGLFELADLPYVGAGVLGSAAGMDKIISKQLFRQEGLPVAPYVWFDAQEFPLRRTRIITEIEKRLGYPCFVKPANMGSSVGISKVRTRKELLSAIELAVGYDLRVLVEKSIERAREVEIGVLGNARPESSIPGEIIPSNEFYDYDAKYVDGKSRAVIPARLPATLMKTLRDYAVRSFTAIDCQGMARVDFLISPSLRTVVVNEINTIPGFTSISMFPKLWEASGLPYGKLLDRLIQLAIERHELRKRLKTTFTPKSEWFRS